MANYIIPIETTINADTPEEAVLKFVKWFKENYEIMEFELHNIETYEMHVVNYSMAEQTQ